MPTPLRNIRVPDEEWDEALKAAAKRGENLSVAIRRFLRGYAKRTKK